MCKVFSAVEAQKSRSSIVAVKVANVPSQKIVVITLQLSLIVVIFSPFGVFMLSGETALATASAVLVSGYSRVIVACKYLAL